MTEIRTKAFGFRTFKLEFIPNDGVLSKIQTCSDFGLLLYSQPLIALSFFILPICLTRKPLCYQYARQVSLNIIRISKLDKQCLFRLFKNQVHAVLSKFSTFNLTCHRNFSVPKCLISTICIAIRSYF